MSIDSRTTVGMRHLVSTITCRWEITILIALAGMAVYTFGSLAGDATPKVSGLILSALFGGFAQGLCSVLNDITDVEADRIHHPTRPLPSGRVTIRQAWLVVGVCLVGTVVCGLALAATPISYLALAGHVGFSLAYSLPKMQWGHHWFLGPIALSASTVCGSIFLLSCTALFQAGAIGRETVYLIGGICFLHYLLVIPLKDIKDIEGDEAIGRTSLAMRLPRSSLHAIAVVGYVLPWILLYALARYFFSYTGESEAMAALQLLAIVFGLLGLVMSFSIVLASSLLTTSQRFCWFAELGLLGMFQFALPLALLAVSAN